MLREIIERDSMVCDNVKIDLKNKLNADEYTIFECRESKNGEKELVKKNKNKKNYPLQKQFLNML
jgi:hypothetical protein